MSNKEVKPGDTVELKDKESGFYDDETNFKVVRDQQVKLGDSIGKRTNAALMSGGLLIVGKSKTEKTKGNDFPEDFPEKDLFIKAGKSFEQLRKMKKEQVEKIEGITPEIMTAMEDWAKANQEK